MRTFLIVTVVLALPQINFADEPTTVSKAESVTIDGVLDEACWKAAAPIRADYLNSKQGVLSDDPRMLVRYAWDDHYLYIGYETFDKNLVTVATGKTQGPADNARPGCEIYKDGVKVDVAEFFISFGDPQHFWELHHNGSNQFNDVWCVVAEPKSSLDKSTTATYGIVFCHEEFLKDDEVYKTAMAVKLKPKTDGSPSTLNDDTDVDTGYTAEIRLPWLAIGAPAEARTFITDPPATPKEKPKRHAGPWKMTGRSLQILAVTQDGDLAERYHHSSPTRKGDWFHKTQPLWPGYQLAQ